MSKDTWTKIKRLLSRARARRDGPDGQQQLPYFS